MKVSVSIVTYQQRALVRQAVESVLAQQTGFDLEIVIGDDASTDGTQDVLRALAGEFPDRIRLILAERNHGDGGLTNFMATLDATTGDYVAFLDGDDFWTDPAKLRDQVAFLERHPECAICAHPVLHLLDSGRTLRSPRPGRGDRVVDADALLVSNFAEKIATMVRREAVERLPDSYRTTRTIAADWLFNVLVSRDAKIGYIDRVMATHRLHRDSQTLTHGTERVLADKLDTLHELKKHLKARGFAIARANASLRAKLLFLRVWPGGYTRLKSLGRSADH